MEFSFDFFCGEAAEVERKIAQNIPFTRRCFHHFHFFGFLSSLSSPHLYLYMLASKTLWVSFTIITSHVSSAGSPNSVSQEGHESLRVPSVHIFHFLSCFCVFYQRRVSARELCNLSLLSCHRHVLQRFVSYPCVSLYWISKVEDR